MVKKVHSESQILLISSKLAKVSVWHKISLLAYTEVSIHCKWIFDGCKIVSYQLGIESMSEVTTTRDIEWKKLKKPPKLVWPLCLHKHILAITFYYWQVMVNKHILLTSLNQVVVCDEFEEYCIILATISLLGDSHVTH